MKEQIARHGSDDPAAIARDISRDFVAPSLAELDTKLRAAGKLLRRKSRMNLLAGSAGVTVGLAASAPLVIGAGITAIAAGLGNIHERAEALREIEESDLYFLWEAKRRDVSVH